MSMLESVGFAIGWCGYPWQKRFFETRVFTPIPKMKVSLTLLLGVFRILFRVSTVSTV
jgi:hypothetical protein